MKPDLPDWRLASAYPAEAPARWWAWQFLRRNLDYQSDWRCSDKTWMNPDPTCARPPPALT